jgi:formylglycine-generating enzyme required for sulfatase activity
MVVVPAGSFTMGGPTNVEQPQHTVMFAKPFAVSKYEVTFADWDACVKGGGCNAYSPNDQHWGRGQQPVINVNWDDAQAYVAWLSAVTGKTYRLLSEAKYEYAVRAGTTTAYPWGDDIKLNGQAMANCDGCGSKWDKTQTAPVGSFPPNKFGLYDMVGNVWEWTQDCVHNDYNGAPTDGSAWIAGGDCSNRLLRGGSWFYSPDYLRSAFRFWITSNARSFSLGFRVARTLLTP